MREGIHPKYRRESLEDEDTKHTLDCIVSCERHEPRKKLSRNDADGFKDYEVRKGDIRDFIAERLKRKSISTDKISELMQDEDEHNHKHPRRRVSWDNFRKVGRRDGQDQNGNTKYKNASEHVVMTAFCAAAQLTKTPLKKLIVDFLEYCDQLSLVIPELVQYKDHVESLRREARTASEGLSANALEPASSDEPRTRLPTIHGADSWLNAYNSDEIPFVGRGIEQKRLDEFITCRDPFRIWAIIAPSGAGKTRLMVHWANSSTVLKSWRCRPLHAEDRDNPERWSEWSPNSHTLIIVDYMFGYDNVLKHLIRRCQKKLAFSVRLLVIDHKISDPIESDERWGFSVGGESLDHKKVLFFDEEPLSLLEPSDQEEVITPIIITRAKLDPSNPKIEEAKAYLRRTKAAWHPLFAALVGNAIKEGKDYAAWNRRDLIKYYLKGKALPWEELGKCGMWAACFIAAATARRGMRLTDLLNAPCPTNVTPPENLTQVIDICRKIVPDSDADVLLPFEPDLLGESFFLLFFDNLKYQKEFRDIFSQIFAAGDELTTSSDAIEFIGFVRRLIENLIIDYPVNLDVKALHPFLDFLRPLNFPDGHPLRWAINISLVELLTGIGLLVLEDTEDMWSRVIPEDFCKINDADLLYLATQKSMGMLNCAPSKYSTESAFNAFSTLWDRNKESHNSSDYDPLFIAITTGLYNVVFMLLVLSDYRTRMAVTSRHGYTPLMAALLCDQIRIAELLLPFTSPTELIASNVNGSTALMLAATKGYFKIVFRLVEAGADVGAKENRGVTALMFACFNGRADVVALLLERDVGTLNSKDNRGHTALMLAAIRGHVNVVALLLNAAADVHIKNNVGSTALALAEAENHTEIVELLQSRCIS